MSLVTQLARQSLIAQKNDLQFQMLQNNSIQRGMLNNPLYMGNLEMANALESSLVQDNLNASTQLMALNAELNALKDTKLNYLAYLNKIF